MGQIVMRAQVDSRTAGQPDSRTGLGQIVKLSCRAKPLYPLCHLCDTMLRAVGVHGVEGLCYWLYIQYIYLDEG